MRAVLDTNVLVSALFWRGSSHTCIQAAEAGLYVFISADEILQELHDKLIEKFDNTPEEAQASVAGFRRLATLVSLSGQSGWVRDDPDDDKFIEAAIVGNAEVVVSGDHHVLKLRGLQGIEVSTPRRFLERLARSTR